MAANLAYLNTIQISILIIVGIMVWLNGRLSIKQKRIYIFTFALVSFISVIEYNAFIFNGSKPKWRFICYLSNYLGLALAPFVITLFAYAINPSKNIKWPLAIIGLFEIFLIVSIPFDLVFKIDEENIYGRGPFFYFYTISFLVGIIYLLITTIQMGSRYQNSRPFILYLIFAFVLFAVLIQILFPQIHGTWFFVTALTIVHYQYCNNLWNQIDGLTELLSQESFISDTKNLKNNGILVIFDIDNFKLINDTYGHSIGDEYLKVFSEKILNVYSEHGLCYRIGGDEFVVILEDTTDVYELNRKFYKEISDYNKYYDTNPDVSFGVSLFKKGDDILKIKDEADARMYKLKHQHQENNKK